jgi:cyclic pyranopterin phosphate synthase
MNGGLTHVDARGQPTMVDVGHKAVTERTAVAEARVVLPGHVAATLESQGFSTRKGPVFQTAIIAGTMAAKRTHELIPFCHPLPLDGCRIAIHMEPDGVVVIRASVAVQHRTGVEMEALTAASVGLLTIYDMCKAVDRGMTISDVRLLEKLGGKSGHWQAE